MTILRSFVALALCLVGASADTQSQDANFEFGRSASPLILRREQASGTTSTVRASVRRKEKRLPPRNEITLDEELEFLELQRELLDLSMSMSMSFIALPDTPSTPSAPSLSFPTPPTSGGPTNPSNPSIPSSPSSPSTPLSPSGNVPMPTLAPELSPAVAQSPASPTPTVINPASPYPTFENAPTNGPAFAGDTPIPANTDAPTFTGSPSLNSGVTENFAPGPSLAPTTVFDLSKETNGVIIVDPPVADATVVRLEIRYLVEALVPGTSNFRSELDWLILKTAVVASLEGNNAGVLDQLPPPPRRLMELQPSKEESQMRHLLSSSAFLRSCNATDAEAFCYIMEADIIYILNGNRDTDMSAYLAYLALNSEMSSFDQGLANVSRVEYLSPQPILPVTTEDSDDSGSNNLLSSGGNSVGGSREVTFGAAAACSVLGCFALAFLYNNRRYRHDNQHVLLDDLSDLQTGGELRETYTREVVNC